MRGVIYPDVVSNPQRTLPSKAAEHQCTGIHSSISDKLELS